MKKTNLGHCIVAMKNGEKAEILETFENGECFLAQIGEYPEYRVDFIYPKDIKYVIKKIAMP